MKKLFVLASLSFFVFACSHKTSTPAAPKSAEQTAFETTCSRCHKAPKPSSKTAEDWKRIVDIMQKKGKFDDSIKSQVLSYLTSKAKL